MMRGLQMRPPVRDGGEAVQRDELLGVAEQRHVRAHVFAGCGERNGVRGIRT